jgi:hypothetical protein
MLTSFAVRSGLSEVTFTQMSAVWGVSMEAASTIPRSVRACCISAR